MVYVPEELRLMCKVQFRFSWRKFDTLGIYGNTLKSSPFLSESANLGILEMLASNS